MTNSISCAPNNNQDNKKCEQGGFVAVLHTLEEQFYGPDSPLDAKGKVMLYIRHRALRDWTERKQISKSEILEATGLKSTALKDALRALEQKEFILVTRTKVGKVWGDNVYQLHPKKYGKDYIYRPEKPSFRVIYGSKHKSNPHLGRKTDLDVGQNTDSEVGRKTDLGSDSNHSELFANSDAKNPLKEPIKKTLSETVKNFPREMTSEQIEQRKRFLHEQAKALRSS